MKEFFVGLVVLVLLGILSVVGMLLLPVILVLGFFVRFIIGILVFIFVVWLVGKAVLLSLDYLKKRETNP